MAPRTGSGKVLASPTPLVFGHRGGAKLAPENTLTALARGVACGADGVECDVQLSRDGVPVVIHDRTLDRTTDRSGPVDALTAAELAAVDAACHFAAGDGFPLRGQGIGVPALEQVLRQLPGTRVIIELKQGDPALARAVIDVLRRTDAVARVCVGSFHRRALEVMRREAPGVETSASEPEARWTLHRSWIRWPARGPRPYHAFQVPEVAGRLRVVTPAFIRQVHGEGATVQVWVVDRPEDIVRLLDWGVDGIISDRPDVAITARDAWVRRTTNDERRTKNTGTQEPRNPGT